jgi:hypothetical protein
LAKIRYHFWASVIGNVITGFATVGIFYWLYRAVDVAAGKHTDFSAVANAPVRMNADRYI